MRQSRTLLTVALPTGNILCCHIELSYSDPPCAQTSLCWKMALYTTSWIYFWMQPGSTDVNKIFFVDCKKRHDFWAKKSYTSLVHVAPRRLSSFTSAKQRLHDQSWWRMPEQGRATRQLRYIYNLHHLHQGTVQTSQMMYRYLNFQFWCLKLVTVE